jgi:hypothetical protein
MHTIRTSTYLRAHERSLTTFRKRRAVHEGPHRFPLSLAANANLDYSWSSFEEALDEGIFSSEEEVIVVRSNTSSMKGPGKADTRLAVLIVIALEALALPPAWSQQSDQPRMPDEFAKQQKIYGSQGSDVPKGYITGRGLSDYAEILPSGFCDALGKLKSSDQWLDIGAGEGQAILDYYAPEDDKAPAGRCARPRGQARAVAMSIEDRRTEKWKQQAATLGEAHISYVSGKPLRHYSREELGKFKIITDVYGGFSYTDDLYQFTDKVLNILDVGGSFYTMVQGVHLENGKDKANASYQTELVDAAGRDLKVCSWLKQITCTQVVCDSKSDWDSPTELISIRKICSDVSVPPVKLLKYEAGNPPARRFQSER